MVPHFDAVRAEVLRAVSEREGRDPGALPPFPDEVDPDSFTRLFERSPERKGEFHAVVTFPYAGYRITVRHDGEFSLTPIGSSESRVTP